MEAISSRLPTFQMGLEQIAAAARRDGWLCECLDADRFLLPCRELVAALAELLGSLGAGPVLEVCAGGGELSEALRAAGAECTPTDACPPHGAPVESLSAGEALRRYRPSVVLGSFVPVDSGVERMILGFSSVRHYVVLGGRIGGQLGSAALWEDSGWVAQPLEEITRRMLTRHDVWVEKQTVLRHGEAWHFRRREPSALSGFTFGVAGVERSEPPGRDNSGPSRFDRSNPTPTS